MDFLFSFGFFLTLSYHLPMDKINSNTLVFDFNGTLIDDLDICLELLNKMLKEKGHEGNISKEKYLSIFTFPIIDYYTESGFRFPKDDFPSLAKEFDIDYRNAFPNLKLFSDVKEVLAYFHKKKRLIVLSATKQDNLEEELKMNGIYDYFDAVIGIKDIYGRSKVGEAKEYFSKTNINPEEMTFIGDTLHDDEVAKEIGGKSILVARGHQNKERLSSAKDAIILNSLKELETIIK